MRLEVFKASYLVPSTLVENYGAPIEYTYYKLVWFDGFWRSSIQAGFTGYTRCVVFATSPPRNRNRFIKMMFLAMHHDDLKGLEDVFVFEITKYLNKYKAPWWRFWDV